MMKHRYTGLGTATQLATVMAAGTVTNSLTGAGTNQATALAITDDINIFTTTASSTGCILRTDLGPGDVQIVVNYGAQTLSVYPPGTGKIQNGSASAAFSVAPNKAAMFICHDGGPNASLSAILSA